MTKDIDQKIGPSKTCTKCGEAKPLEEYYVHAGAKDGRKGACKECVKASFRQARRDDPDHARALDKKSKEKHKDKKKARDKKYRAENRDRLREQQKEWKKANPDKVKASGKRYRKKNAEKIRDKQRDYEKEHAERRREWAREWRKKNPEKAAERSRRFLERHREVKNARNLAYMKERYLNDPEYREAQKAYARAYGKIWRQEKKELTRVHTIARRARLVEADGTHTAADIARIHEDQGFCCVYCETSTIDSYHVDHKTPLSRGGSNWPENIQILCPHCNVSKWSRTDEEFREWRSRLVPANDNTGVDEEETG